MISLAETEIYLIRHGETTLTNAKQYVGSSDIPLSEQGKAQARQLAEKLRAAQFDACYCSPLGRCRDTAQIVAAPHQLDPLPIPALREIDYGAWELMTVPQMQARAPELLPACRFALAARILCGFEEGVNMSKTLPAGETPAGFANRNPPA